MDILTLYNENNISFQTEGHKHCRPGWANVICPFCEGNPGLHLGYSLEDNYFQCWRCGYHPTEKVISILLKIPWKETKVLIKHYGGVSVRLAKTHPDVKIREKAHVLPTNTFALNSAHKKYLEKRKFDPDYLEKEWKLLGTGPTSFVDNLPYKFRIIAPFIWNYQQVTYQGRDITEKTAVKYKACPKDRELLHHKHILYGQQNKWRDTGICVEGVTDVWRLGVNAFSTSGIKFTPQQIRVIANNFKRVPVIFDDEPQAVSQAKKLVGELKFRGVESFYVPIVGDPGEMDQKEANYLVKQLIH